MTANRVWAIAEDDKGNMWFGSYGDGLYKYDGKNFHRYSVDDGLFGNHIRVLIWSEYYHCLIVGGEGGVSSIRGDSIISSPPDVFSPDKGAPVTGLGDMGKFIYVTTYGINNPLRFYPETNEFIEADTSNLRYPGNSFSVFLSSRKDRKIPIKKNMVKNGAKSLDHKNPSLKKVSTIKVFVFSSP